MSLNGVMMQYFEWYVPEDGTFWTKAAKEARKLADVGITAVWLPPAFKCQSGIHANPADVAHTFNGSFHILLNDAFSW